MSKEVPPETVYKGDYLWPYIAPIIYKPCKPPETVDLFLEEERDSPLNRDLCHCDKHDWSPHFRRAKHLKEKERAYREAMIQVASERTILENEILLHPCTDVEDALTSLYSKDYAKREYPIAAYRAMKQDHDDPIVTPAAILKDPRQSGYRDDSSFRKTAMKPADIEAPRDVYLNTVPNSEFCENLYTSEYSGRISKAGYNNFQQSQRFRSNK